MSNINNIENILVSENSVFADYKSETSSSNSDYVDSTKLSSRNKSLLKNELGAYGSDQSYSVSLAIVRQEADNTISKLNGFKSDLENLLRQVNLDPFNNISLEESHKYVWNQINNMEINFPKIEVENYPGDIKYPTPPFICFDQYLYSETGDTRGYRRFVKEYDNLISNSSFGHLYDYREIIKYLLVETSCIKQSLTRDFGTSYEDESQQQVASHYFYWLKMALHYQKLFAENIPFTPTPLPQAEVDKASKKQAAQFQAFFSIKVDSLTTVIDSQLESLYGDLVTNCNVFYDSFLGPALRFKTKVVSDFSVDLRTTNMKSVFPIMSEEAVIALLVAEGNFKSILSDLIERRNITTSKLENLYQNILQRRKYTNYISQLAIKAIKKQKIVTQNTNENYETLLQSITKLDNINILKSSHALLDDLNEDSHPQYLMRSGGKISGDISVENDAKVDGVKISTHSHNGVDGSERIKSIDIDYDSGRKNIKLKQINSLQNEVYISVDSFIPDILQGGIPVADVNISIEVPDEFVDKYDFEILYTEL
jgi:hypothetical protein